MLKVIPIYVFISHYIKVYKILVFNVNQRNKYSLRRLNEIQKVFLVYLLLQEGRYLVTECRDMPAK